MFSSLPVQNIGIPSILSRGTLLHARLDARCNHGSLGCYIGGLSQIGHRDVSVVTEPWGNGMFDMKATSGGIDIGWGVELFDITSAWAISYSTIPMKRIRSRMTSVWSVKRRLRGAVSYIAESETNETENLLLSAYIGFKQVWSVCPH